jgi:hypothetical protein
VQTHTATTAGPATEALARAHQRGYLSITMSFRAETCSKILSARSINTPRWTSQGASRMQMRDLTPMN